MTFTYRCVLDHVSEHEFKVGAAPAQVKCPVVFRGFRNAKCFHLARRDFAADASSITVGVVDPFRSFHLSTKKDAAAQHQQREIGGPTDSFERRRIEKQRGIQFVGDDTSGMSAAARRGIEKARDKVSCGEVKP